MRKRLVEENSLERLRRLNGVVPTAVLIAMLIDLADQLEHEGQIVNAKIASLAANRLDNLSRHRPR